MSDYKEILTSDRVYKKYKSIIPDTNVSIDDIIQKLSYFYKISKDTSEKGMKILDRTSKTSGSDEGDECSCDIDVR